ncbi:RNA polymerase sigma factor [uncultured Sunxiuqinia sp.]|uniref:RNA polymerase sigma factor n=1 Tax=uncultured Sunxiuqinia sp. TaxID=1573825 RepID=UPI002AA8EF56|nr:RNA polymerase sigma factor [uncultured Sunxiuqinia sp.]
MAYLNNNIDKECWESFIEGEENAFSSIYRKSMDDLYSYGLSKTSYTDIIEDTIQDVFITLFNKRHLLDPSQNLQAYLFRSFRNMLIERLRERSRKEEFVYKHATVDAESALENIEDAIIRTEESDKYFKLISKCMASLSDRQREAVYLKYTSGYSYEDISEILEIDVASSRTLIYRSIKKIRELLGREVIVFFLFIKKIQ